MVESEDEEPWIWRATVHTCMRENKKRLIKEKGKERETVKIKKEDIKWRRRGGREVRERAVQLK